MPSSVISFMNIPKIPYTRHKSNINYYIFTLLLPKMPKIPVKSKVKIDFYRSNYAIGKKINLNNEEFL